MEYQDFLASKHLRANASGFEAGYLNPNLFQWQAEVVRWACKQGNAAIFAECGLGKTLMQLAWAEQVAAETQRPVLILTPLAVARQTLAEADRFLIQGPVIVAESGDDVREAECPIVITNYHKLHKFDTSVFAGVVLDESSILKSFMGKTKRALIDAFSQTPYRLACTATPSPNDFMELGNHAEFLGVMPSSEMLARWFINDLADTGKYRVKGHAEKDFWAWVASWAACVSKPSDLGYPDDGYELPDLDVRQVVVEVDISDDTGERLFRGGDLNATNLHAEMRRTAKDRAAKVLELIYGECSLSGMVSREQGQDRQGEEEGVHEGILRQEEIGEVGEEDARASGKTQRIASEEVCRKPIRSRKSESRCKEVAGVQSGEKKGAEASPVQLNRGAVRGDADSSAIGVPDLRILGTGQAKHISTSGPLPQDGQGSRPAVCELQPRAGKVQGLARTATQGGGVSENCRLKWIIWVNTNYEQDVLEKLLPRGDFVSVRGSDTDGDKVDREQRWREGNVPIMICKPSMFGHGLNWQHCSNVAFVGLSYSFEQYYQAVRRCWRFGQKRPVKVHIVMAETETAILSDVLAKQGQHQRMIGELAKATRASGGVGRERCELTQVQSSVASGRAWTLPLGDCVEAVKAMEDASIDFTIFSPPFSNLYIYSDSAADMGNSADDAEFMAHFGFLVPELFRVTTPGRLCAVHCKDLPRYAGRDGTAGLKDFPGELIRLFTLHGWSYHSRVTIWKCPVVERERTNNNGLLHKTIKRDSSRVRQGMADFLLVFRRPPVGTLLSDKPIVRQDGLTAYHGDCDPRESGFHPSPFSRRPSDDPALAIWQRYAEPVWWDIDQMDVLNYRIATSEKDEKHICPLQLGLIRRAVHLWSNPGDTVLSPFAGVGSEGVVAVEEGRRFVGVELKPEYWRLAQKHLRQAEEKANQLTLFDNLAA